MLLHSVPEKQGYALIYKAQHKSASVRWFWQLSAAGSAAGVGCNNVKQTASSRLQTDKITHHKGRQQPPARQGLQLTAKGNAKQATANAVG